MPEPFYPILFPGAYEVPKTQAGFCPFLVFLGAMDVAEHDCLFESLTKLSTLSLVLPQVIHILWASVVIRLSLAHAPIVDGF